MARNAMYINKKTGPKSRVEVRAGHEASTHTDAKVQIYSQITNKTRKKILNGRKRHHKSRRKGQR